MIIEIKHRSTGATLWSSEAENLRGAVTEAVAARAYLADADLAGADLAGANLARANLAGAYLADAYLAGADLADANLAGADLADAYLADADLARANLARAYLAGAYLADANLADANLADADLAGAYLADAYLADARNKPASIASHVDPKEPYERKPNLTRQERMADYRKRHPEVPVVENLDAKILEAVSKPGQSLDMSAWHSCATTHCRAGWAIHLAGDAGYELEKKMRYPGHAGRAIYLASTGRAPWFFAPTDVALEDIKKCAAEEGATLDALADEDADDCEFTAGYDASARSAVRE